MKNNVLFYGEIIMINILPINEKPSIITCIHHAYPCAIIESKELAIVSVNNFLSYKWNYKTYDTAIQFNDGVIKILEDGKGENTNAVLWRKCEELDEMLINVEYIKVSNFTRYIDIFLFHNDLENEILKEDKTCGIRWNPYGYFIEKNMYSFDTNLYTYIKLCLQKTYIECYASKDGDTWEYIDQKDLPQIYIDKDLNIGIHIYCGKNQFRVWKYMNFIQLIYNESNPYKGIYLDYYFFPRKNYDNSYFYFSNFIDTHYDLLYDALDCFPSIHEYLQWNIKHLYYVNLCLDEYYVVDRKAYKKYHYNHYNLFYGFDDNKRIYYIMGYGMNSTPVISEISYDVLNYNNIITSANIVRYKYLANQVTELKFSIKPIISGLYEFLHDVNSSEKVGNLITGENVFYGISVLKKLATTDIGKQNIRSDKRIAYLLFEYSRIMEERLNYLYENNYLKKDQYISLFEHNVKIQQISSILLNLVLKNMIKPINDDRIDHTLLRLYENNKIFIEKFLNILIEYSQNC